MALHALIAGLAYRTGGRRLAQAPLPAHVEVDLLEPPPEAPKELQRPEDAAKSAAEAPPNERSERPEHPPAPARLPERTPKPPSAAPGARGDAPEVLADESPEPGLDAFPSGGDPKPREAPARPRLSLDALGIGSQNPFLDAGPPSDGRKHAVTAQEIQARLDHALTDDLARADQARGLGPEGPLIASLEAEARRSATSPTSSALFRLSTDGNGTVIGVQIIGATSDAARWKEVGERVLVEYARKKLRGKHGARGLSFEIRVTSRVVLPSGSESGVGVKSPSMNDASPGLKGDVADIGARAVRRVQARLERIWAN